MSRKTNKTIEIWTNERNWQGDTAITLVGSYDVYLEENATKDIFSMPEDKGSHSDAVQNSSRGFFILYENINMDKKLIKYDGESYIVKKWDRFTDRKKAFHHSEVTYI